MTFSTICDKTVVGIMQQTDGKLVLEILNPSEETLVLVYQVVGLTQVNGMLGLVEGEFDGDPGYLRTLRAFQRIGAENAASVLEESLNLWNSTGDKDAFYRENTNEWRRMYALENKFLRMEDKVLEQLEQFISNHPEDFEKYRE